MTLFNFYFLILLVTYICRQTEFTHVNCEKSSILHPTAQKLFYGMFQWCTQRLLQCKFVAKNRHWMASSSLACFIFFNNIQFSPLFSIKNLWRNFKWVLSLFQFLFHRCCCFFVFVVATAAVVDFFFFSHKVIRL